MLSKLIEYLKLNTMILLTGLLSLSWFTKSVILIRELHINPNMLFLSLSSFGLALVIISIFSGSKRSSFLAFFIYLGMTILQYADLLYLRYYYSILRIELLTFVNQLFTIQDSILSLTQLKDMIYFIDLPIMFLIIWFLHAKKIDWTFTRTIRSGFAIIGIILLLVLSFNTYKTNDSDQFKVSLTGVIPAHIHDASMFLYNKVNPKKTVIEKDQIEKLRKEFESNQALQKPSPYYGKFKGKKIVMVQAESLNTFPIGMTVEGQSVTPILDKLISESHYYPNTYLQIGKGNTSDAEFVANNSIYPMTHLGAYKGYPRNEFLSLGQVLKANGYSVSATHGNDRNFWNRGEAYPNQGYDQFYHVDHPKIDKSEIIELGISDESLFKQMVDIYKKEEKPFYNFFVSLSNHRPFILPDEYQYLNLSPPLEGTSTGHYLQSVRYFDKALGIFIKDLQEANLWDETIFIVYGDHYGPLSVDEEEIKELLDVTFDKKESFKIPLIIHHPEQNVGVFNEGTGSQMDIYPTITSLLGIEEQLVQFGTSLDTDHNQIVGFAYEIARNSFFSDDYDYLASFQSGFESGTCIDNKTNKTVELEMCKKGYEEVKKDIELSEFLLKEDLITKIFNK